jgi:hypothetical protein
MSLLVVNTRKLLSRIFHTNGITHHVFICVWLLSLSLMALRFNHAVAWFSILFHYWVILLYTFLQQSISFTCGFSFLRLWSLVNWSPEVLNKKFIGLKVHAILSSIRTSHPLIFPAQDMNYSMNYSNSFFQCTYAMYAAYSLRHFIVTLVIRLTVAVFSACVQVTLRW